MNALGFASQVRVTAQVKIIATKSEKALTKCENFSFLAQLKTGVKEDEQKENMEILAKSRFRDEFFKRMREDASLKHSVGSTQWHVEVVHVSYE